MSEHLRQRNARRLDRKIDEFSDVLPGFAGGMIRWIRHGASRWLRVTIALLLIVGGIFGFLPVLGFWMVPLGLLFLSLDVPAIQQPLLRAIVRTQKWWRGRKRRKR